MVYAEVKFKFKCQVQVQKLDVDYYDVDLYGIRRSKVQTCLFVPSEILAIAF